MSQSEKRVVWTEDMKKIFDKLYSTHDGGRFFRLMTDKNCSKNMERRDAWDGFLAAFNAVSV